RSKWACMASSGWSGERQYSLQSPLRRIPPLFLVSGGADRTSVQDRAAFGTDAGPMRRYLPLVLTMVFWASSFATSKLTVSAVPVAVAVALRFGGGAVVLLAVVLATGQRVRPGSASGWSMIGLLGLLGVFGYNFLFFFALTIAPAGDGCMIVPVLSPVITTVATAVLGRDRLSVVRLVGLVLAGGGAVVFFLGTPIDPGTPHRLLGDLVFVAGAVAWSAYTLCGRPVLRRFPPLPVTAYACAIGALLLALASIPFLGQVHAADLNGRFWLTEAYLMIFPTAMAFPLFYRGVRLLGPARAATTMFLVPVFGLAIAFALLGETVTVVQAVGSVLMLTGAWLAVTERPTARHGSATDSGLQLTGSV
ncbi:MAG TPA: DMT family transporter, partial [Pseudonocardiaceae bacterium]|nr:DMT family transporter [Pseudonocardiaceae bacterium]